MTRRYKTWIIAAAALLWGGSAQAQEITFVPDTATSAVEPADTAQADEHWFRLHVIARTYGDRVLVRWAPDEFVPWKFLNGYGYLVQRVTHMPDGSLKSDTIAARVHPLTRKQFMERFEENDSLAGAAVQTIFGQMTTLDQTEHAPGTTGSIIEVYEEQQNVFGFAMLVAEMRPDLAEAMGLAYTDRDVRPGEQYDYIVRPLVPDSVLKVRPGIVYKISNDQFKPVTFETQLTDSLMAPASINLYWPRDNYTAYDIERRRLGGIDEDSTAYRPSAWTQLNEHPYISMLNPRMREDEPNMYTDYAVKPGVYEYRIRAYDTFGDRTNPSNVVRVAMPDLVAPSAPHLYHIDVERGDTIITAKLFWRKDTIEADMAGFLPVYYNAELLADRWLPLSSELIPPTDTTCTVVVTGLGSGTVAIAALDSAGNMTASLPQTLRIGDLTPPHKPARFRGFVNPQGIVTLMWSPVLDRDLYSYEVWFANSPYHQFEKISPSMMRDTIFQDTISTRNNQRYVYYKLKAVDWSSNVSDETDVLPITVPNFDPPVPCRIDSVYHDDEVIRMWWIGSNEASVKWHRVFRKLGTDGEWTLIKMVDVDTLLTARFLVEDRPPLVQQQRYYYTVETLSLMGSSSGPSMQQSFLHDGPRVIDIPIHVEGDFDKSKNENRLVWKPVNVSEAEGPWHFCIWRKGPNDDDFKFLIAEKSDSLKFTDRLGLPGETAEYYVSIRFSDGRRSQASNIVKITRPRN